MGVSKVNIIESKIYENGTHFGNIGSYQELDLEIHYEITENDYAHEVITDLSHCKFPDGVVRFSTNAKILKPTDNNKGNNKIILDVPNRGRNLILKMINNAPEASSKTSAWDSGNGFLLQQGYTVVWCGWQHDVPAGDGLLRIAAPQPTIENKPIVGNITMTIQSNLETKTHMLSERGHTPLPAYSIEQLDATLTVQDNENDEPNLIDRETWSFGTDLSGAYLPDANYLYLETGLIPGKIYRVTYKSINPVANGVGLLAVRDLISFLKKDNNPELCQTINQVYGFGHSQSGRFLRHFIYLGLNLDENEEKVFDGLIVHAAGARRGEFNQRFAQPSSAIKQSTSNLPPFAPITPQHELGNSILDIQYKRGGMPNIFFVNTASEYWWAHASLAHTDPSNNTDLNIDPLCRLYYYSGTQHSSGKFPLTNYDSSNGVKSEQYFNFIDYRPSLRALFMNLTEWVEDDTNPPENKIPRIDNGTLISYESLCEKYKLSGVIDHPVHIKQISQMEFSVNSEDVQNVPLHIGLGYPVLVPDINSSHNEFSGITLPEVSNPLAMHFGWNLRHSDIGGPGQVLGTTGGSILLDPSCIPNKADYLQNISNSYEDLMNQRLILKFDKNYIMEEASSHYDAIVKVMHE